MTMRTLIIAAASAAMLLACEVTVTKVDSDVEATPEDTAGDDTADALAADVGDEDAGPVVEETPCDIYCGLAEANCTEDNAIDWGVSTCADVCASYASNPDYEAGVGGDSIECRTYHLGAPAEEDPATHCPHGSPAGGGVCVDETNYYAVLVEDIFNGKCGSSGAPGADIDAVELQDDEGNSLGYWDVATMMANPDGDTTCTYDAAKDTDENGVDDIYEDASQAEGAPDGTLTTNFVSLYGGWIIGEFANTADGDELYVMSGDTLVIHEVGKANPNVGEGIDEAFSVGVATELDCVNQENWRETCYISQGDLDGYGSVVVAIEGM